MSDNAKLIIEAVCAVGYTIIAIAGLCAICWVVWSVGWHLFDTHQQKTRRSMARFKPRSERQAYRDLKGTHR